MSITVNFAPSKPKDKTKIKPLPRKLPEGELALEALLDTLDDECSALERECEQEVGKRSRMIDKIETRLEAIVVRRRKVESKQDRELLAAAVKALCTVGDHSRANALAKRSKQWGI